MFFPLVMVVTGYISTMAIFYLAYSIVWKKIDYKHFLVFSNTLAILISLIAFISRSHHLLTILQTILLVFTVLIIFSKPRKKGKKSYARVLYLLIALFWLINLIIIGPKKLIPFEAMVTLQGISVIIFMLIYLKVRKWAK